MHLTADPQLCPNCGSERLRDSRWKTLFESVVSTLLRARIVRCRDCQYRYALLGRLVWRKPAWHKRAAEGTGWVLVFLVIACTVAGSFVWSLRDPGGSRPPMTSSSR